MEHEIVNREAPEMKQLISGIREVSKRIREITQMHRPLFEGEIYLTGRHTNAFSSPLVLYKTIEIRGLFHTSKLQEKSSTNSPTSIVFC